MEISPKPPKPRASIALVAYNQQDTIVESVNSILNQDGKDLEILLSDDCSSDGTYNLIEKAYKQYKGPHLLKINRNQYNMGIGAHVHHAASLTSGDYIVMASGDDLSLPNRVKKSLAVVEREGEMGVVVGRYHPFTDCFTDKNDWILDCYAGSGTLAEAANELNRNSINIENDKNYFEIMLQRIGKINNSNVVKLTNNIKNIKIKKS